MYAQRRPRERRRARRRNNSDINDIEVSSYVENEAVDYSEKPDELLTRRRTFSDIGIRRTADEENSDVESDVKSSSFRRKRSSVQERMAHDLRNSTGTFRIKSVTNVVSGEKRKRRKRSQLRNREDGSERSFGNGSDHARRSYDKHRRQTIQKISDNDGSERQGGKMSRYGSSERDELPIIEILRRAPENSRTRYEEPIALPELTTDTIYVQSRNGFSALKIPKKHGGNDKEFELPEECDYRPIKIAIITQKMWKCTGFVYQGILGGMAFMHFVLMQTFFEDSLKFISNYCVLTEIYTNVFSFLIAMCVISVFDKFDVSRLDFEHLREIYANHAKSAIAILLYVISFCLHQVTLKVNDKLSLIYYKSTDSSFVNITKNDSFISILVDEIPIWQRITLSKDILVVLAWIFVSLGTRDDMLLLNLEAMAKSAEASNFSI